MAIKRLLKKWRGEHNAKEEHSQESYLRFVGDEQLNASPTELLQDIGSDGVATKRKKENRSRRGKTD